MAKASDAEHAEVLAMLASNTGWPAAELDSAIAIESAWDPASHNSIRAGGLIGFLRTELPHVGWNDGPEAFWQLSATQQAPYIVRFFANTKRAWKVPGDTYLAIAAPSYIGASDSTVVYPKGGKAWDQNPGWRPSDGGDITAGSIRATLLRRMAGKAGRKVVAAHSGTPVSSVIVALALTGALYWAWTRSRRTIVPGKRFSGRERLLLAG
jgi:hypothetical protein